MKNLFFLLVFVSSWLLFAEEVANYFGIQYDTEKNVFSFNADYDTTLPTDSRSTNPKKHIKAKPIKRLNRYYYVMYGTIGVFKDVFFVVSRYNISIRDKTKYRYACSFIDFDSKNFDLLYATGGILNGGALEKGIGLDNAYNLCKGQTLNIGKIFPDRENLECYVTEEGSYLVLCKSLSPLTPYAWFYFNEEGIAFQVPLSLVWSVWNNIAYGLLGNSSSRKIVRRLYDLKTRKILWEEDVNPDDLDFQQIGHCIKVKDDEAYIAVVHDRKVNQSNDSNEVTNSPYYQWEVFDLKTKQIKDVPYTYRRHTNILLRIEDDMVTHVYNQCHDVLWSGKLPIRNITEIDLDKDVAEEVEVLIFNTGDKQILVNCIDEKVEEAKRIEHIGFGFFKCVKNGEIKWITL